MSDFKLKWTYSVLWMILQRAKAEGNKGGAVWDIAFRHPQGQNSPMTTGLLQFISPQLEEVTHGSHGRLRFCLFLSSGGLLNKKRKHLFGEYKICPRRLSVGSKQLTWPRKIKHSVLPTVSQTDTRKQDSQTPTTFFPSSVFTKLNESKDTCWWDVAGSSSDDNRGSV